VPDVASVGVHAGYVEHNQRELAAIPVGPASLVPEKGLENSRRIHTGPSRSLVAFYLFQEGASSVFHFYISSININDSSLSAMKLAR
jgi:hypothetical protein